MDKMGQDLRSPVQCSGNSAIYQEVASNFGLQNFSGSFSTHMKSFMNSFSDL